MAEKAPKKLNRDAGIRTIRLGDIRINPRAQRDLRGAWAERLFKKFDLDSMGTFTVNERDGFYWLLDGQHRFTALKRYLKEELGEDYEDWTVEAWTYFGLTEAQEAQKFLDLNDQKPISAFDRFTKAVTAEQFVPCDIDRIVRSLGLRVAQGKGTGKVGAVGSLLWIYSQGGPALTVQTLSALRDAWVASDFDSRVLKGVGMFISRYDGRLKREVLVKKLSSITSGAKGVAMHANRIREATGSPIDECYAAAITEIYNRGVRGKNNLGSWWKSSGEASA